MISRRSAELPGLETARGGCESTASSPAKAPALYYATHLHLSPPGALLGLDLRLSIYSEPKDKWLCHPPLLLTKRPVCFCSRSKAKRASRRSELRGAEPRSQSPGQRRLHLRDID